MQLLSKKNMEKIERERFFFLKKLNSIKMCKIQVLLFQCQHVILSYYILKNKHNHTQSILILI